MTPVASLFFVIFAAIQVITYLAIRREWYPPAMAASIAMVGGMLSALFLSIAQGNSILHALLVGFFMGGIISGITLAAAWYFHRNNLRKTAEQAQL
jgi:Na+/H+-translocating membrane pyrophosphatase